MNVDGDILIREGPMPSNPELLTAAKAPNEVDVLVRKLCAKNDGIRAAVVSVETFVALARPSTAGSALWLIEEMGLPMDSALMNCLLSLEGGGSVDGDLVRWFQFDNSLEDAAGSGSPLSFRDDSKEPAW